MDHSVHAVFTLEWDWEDVLREVCNIPVSQKCSPLQPSINKLAENGRPREDRERNREGVRVGERIINKSLISWVFSPPPPTEQPGNTHTRSRIHPQPPAGLAVLYWLLLGGDWFVALALRLSHMMTGVIQLHRRDRGERPIHVQLLCSRVFH